MFAFMAKSVNCEKSALTNWLLLCTDDNLANNMARIAMVWFSRLKFSSSVSSLSTSAVNKSEDLFRSSHRSENLPVCSEENVNY